MAAVSYASVPAGLVKPLLKDFSSKSSFSSASRISSAAECRGRTVCSAEPNRKSALANMSTALALAAIVSTAPLAVPSEALADIAGLTPCRESKAFAKREKQSLKKLENSMKPYAPDSAPALAIKATMEKTKRRFENYGKQGLLCGTDGLPHLIVNGDQAHWGEFITPGILFLYIAGWIGWVGRSYLIAIRGEKKPTEREIIIDVPLATRILWRGFIWPLAAVSAFRNGTLIEIYINTL
eukprot:Gb_12253 [translate_table: standard]